MSRASLNLFVFRSSIIALALWCASSLNSTSLYAQESGADAVLAPYLTNAKEFVALIGTFTPQTAASQFAKAESMLSREARARLADKLHERLRDIQQMSRTQSFRAFGDPVIESGSDARSLIIWIDGERTQQIGSITKPPQFNSYAIRFSVTDGSPLIDDVQYRHETVRVDRLTQVKLQSCFRRRQEIQRQTNNDLDQLIGLAKKGINASESHTAALTRHQQLSAHLHQHLNELDRCLDKLIKPNLPQEQQNAISTEREINRTFRERTEALLKQVGQALQVSAIIPGKQDK